jgi:hypothetical protein
MLKRYYRGSDERLESKAREARSNRLILLIGAMPLWFVSLSILVAGQIFNSPPCTLKIPNPLGPVFVPEPHHESFGPRSRMAEMKTLRRRAVTSVISHLLLEFG